MLKSAKRFGIRSFEQSKRTIAVIYMIVGLILFAIIVPDIVKSPTMKIDYYENLHPYYKQRNTHKDLAYVGSSEVPSLFTLPVPTILFLVGCALYIDAEGKKEFSNRVFAVIIALIVFSLTLYTTIGYMNDIIFVSPYIIITLNIIGGLLAVASWKGKTRWTQRKVV